jgi:membrane protein DedA with SNARE-associated domain
MGTDVKGNVALIVTILASLIGQLVDDAVLYSIAAWSGR